MFKLKEKESCCSTNLTAKPKSNGHDCCSVQPKGKKECPKCKEKAKGVLGKTLEYLLHDDVKINLDCLDGWYYCKTPTCKTIYFRGEEVLTQKDLSVVVGLKDGAKPANMCYCFGWTKELIRADIKQNKKSTVLDDIKHHMNTEGCSCEIKNPSGNCCMADVGKVVKEMTNVVKKAI